MSDTYPCYYKKTDCPHCGEGFLVEFDTDSKEIELYISNADVSTSPRITKARTPHPQGDARYKVNKKGKKRSCKACGELGHRSDNCPKSRGTSRDDLGDLQSGPPTAVPRGAVSRQDFALAKDLQANGENSIGIASEVEIPITAVGRIMGSDDYEEYLTKFA